ncbi:MULTISPECIES: DUF3311 domain-containing protein [unclassified Nocardioides]|uniref:DUF3311 domain-containing protein n=1 Tax=unclassified Nocardioides TaxID=2615069 RepID=UPI000AE59A71|nr:MULTISPECIES: DUF3311 domain-containing protein [unclassified Nocardioides]
MPLGSDSGETRVVPPANKFMLVAAGVLLLIPVVALMWVGSYAKIEPRLWGIPFFFWYQFVWVFLCSAMTYSAHRLVLAARGQSGKVLK